MFGEQRVAAGAAGVYNLYSGYFIDESVFGINSANKYFKTNMAKAVAAVESVLNEYNTEVYLSLSPNKNWMGCDYHDCTGFSNWYQNIDALLIMQQMQPLYCTVLIIQQKKQILWNISIILLIMMIFRFMIY